MDRDQMVAELDAGDSPDQTTTPQAPAAPETGEMFDYSIGGKSFQIPAAAEFSIKHNGQVIKVPASRLINGHRQSSHLEQKLKDISGRYQQYEEAVGPLDKWQERQSELQKLEAIEKWSREHPEDFEYLWNGMGRSQTGTLTMAKPEVEGAGVNVDRLHATISALQNQVQELSGWKSNFEKQQYEQAVEAETAKIEQEASAFEKKYEKYGVKLDEVDDSGISLRGRIFKHAVDNEIKRFEVAALSYLGDTLFDRAAVLGRTEGVKNAKGDVRAGIVGRSGIPAQQGQGQTVDVRKMNPEERRKAALDELMASEGK